MQTPLQNDSLLSYRLVRSSRRKTLGLQVKNAEIIVRAPYFVKNEFIENLIQRKSNWLREKVQQQLKYKVASVAELPTTLFIDGIETQIRIAFDDKFVSLDQANACLTISLDKKWQYEALESTRLVNQVKKHLEQWLKSSFNQYLENRLPELISATQLQPSAVKVRKYRARWGSCNNRSEVSFNYLLKMVPTWVIDYVIVHELCHLVHLNHSAEFWRLVADNYPRYQEAKFWLKQHQHQLVFQ